MKIVIRVFYIILILVFLKFFFAYGANEIFIRKYENGNYVEKLVKSLKFCNISERYIAYYNHGNYYYKKGKYKEAIKEYDKALEKKPPKGKECRIIINKTLSMLTEVDLDNKTVEENLEILYKARKVLCSEGCAADGDFDYSEYSKKTEEFRISQIFCPVAYAVSEEGHNKEAEELKDDIDDLIEKLKQAGGGGGGDEDPNQPTSGDGEDPKPKKGDDDGDDEALKKREREAAKERAEQERVTQNAENHNYSTYGGELW